ncbi:MAG: VOC family protein [Thermomicrobiales bacterium]
MSQATVTIHTTFLPHTDPEASLAFYRDGLGFELRLDVGQGAMRWLTVGPINQPDTAFVLTPAGVGDYSDEEEAVITAMMEKGTFATVILASTDLEATFNQLEESGATVVQEIADQGWGTRDCVFLDPAGNTIRIQQAG